MRKYVIPGLISIVLLLILACGDDATSTPRPETIPAATPAPTADTLADIAAKLAGGPGAIYAGDLSQLVGPAPSPKLGDQDGNVTLGALQNHLWIYESGYYRDLLEKAKLTDPTELVYSGDPIKIQYACIDRTLLPCELVALFLLPNVEARTNGKLNLVLTSFTELGLDGSDTLTQVSDGTLEIAEIYPGYVAGELPALEIQNLWGLYPDKETEFEATSRIYKDLEKLVTDATGSVIIHQNWYSGSDQFFATKKPLRTPEDFQGLKTRSHSAALSDWIEGMGADAQFVGYSEVYGALERGILDAGVTGGDAIFGGKWFEVAQYLNGPLVSMASEPTVINGKIWASIPADLQQILLEEGAKTELEAMRVASILNEMGIINNVNAGMEFIEFSDELKAISTAAATKNVIPAWVKRVGGGDKPIIKLFNEKIGPLVGIKINLDGTVVKTE